MKNTFLTLSLFLLAGLNLQVVAQERVMTSYDVFDLSYVTDAKLSPDAGHIAYLVLKQRPLDKGKGAPSTHLYVYDQKTGTHKAYMVGEHYVSGLAWSHDGNSILFRARLANDKKTNVYAIDLDGGAAYPLVDLPWSVGAFELSPDGRNLAFTSTGELKKDPNKKHGFDQEVYEEDIHHINLYTANVETGDVKALTNGITVSDFHWSPDGKTIAAMVQEKNLTDYRYMFRQLVLINMADGKQKLLVDKHGKMGNISWSPDGKYIAFVSATDIIDPVAGSVYVTEAFGDAKPFSELKNLVYKQEVSVDHVEWLDRQTILFSSEAGCTSTLTAMNFKGGKQRMLIEGGKAIFSGFDIQSSKVVFSGNTSQHPGELYSFDTDSRSLTKLSNSNPWLDKIKMGRQEVIRYKARDGLSIEGVLIYPADYKEGTRYPLICLIHGGPEARMADGWQTYYSRWGQVAAGKGYFVFMPNYRASSGRGVKFSQMDYGDLGDEEFLDVIDGISYLDKQGLIDKKRVGIGGGSYGGYFAALGSTRYSEHFAASVMFVGISNQISKRNTTDIPWEDYHVHWGFWTKDKFEEVYKASPIAYLEKNQTPTLILHGDSDPRVHPSQSLEMYRGLKMHGKAPVRLVWYPGEGHGNRQNPARLDYSLRTLQWFDYYLKGDNPKDQMPPKDIVYDINK